MYYIQKTPTESSNHGNPQGQPFPGSVMLPDDLLQRYLDAKGFVTLTVEGDTVAEVWTNWEALEAYESTHPETPPEPEEEFLSVSDLATALREGVNDV